MSRRAAGLGLALPLLLLAACPKPPPPRRPAPPPAPSGPPAVLFAVLEQVAGLDDEQSGRLSVLVPLACHDPGGGGQLEGGRACLGLVPPDAPVGLEGGQTVKPIARGRPMCGERAASAMGLLFDTAPAGDSTPWAPRIRASYGFWPPAAASSISPTVSGPSASPTCRGWCTFTRTGHPRVKVDPARRARLVLAARAAGLSLEAPDDALEVLQEVSVELDGDDRPERLYSVAVRDLEAAEYSFRFSALLIEAGAGPGAGPRELALLRRRDSDAIIVRGTTDLDGDGRRELWLLFSAASGAGVAHEIVSLADGLPSVVGGYACRPEPEP